MILFSARDKSFELRSVILIGLVAATFHFFVMPAPARSWDENLCRGGNLEDVLVAPANNWADSLATVEASVKACTQKIDINAKEPSAYKERAALYAVEGRRAEAIKDLNTAISIDATDPDLYIARANLNWPTDVKAMIADYTKAIAFHPKDLALRLQLARYSSVPGHYHEAIEQYSIALELDPKNADNYRSRAEIYKKLEQYQDALRDMNSAISLTPDAGYFYLSRAECYKWLCRDQEALVDISKAQQLIGKENSDESAVYGGYLSELTAKVESNWVPPVVPGEVDPEVEFLLTKAGEVRCLKFLKWSKSAAENAAVMEAVRRAAPFRPLSKMSGDKIVTLTFNFRMTTYMNELQERVQAKYSKPKVAAPHLAQVACDVDAAGHASDIRLVASSGDGSVDDSAVNAVINAFPFAEFPFRKWVGPRILELNFTFSPNGLPLMSTPGLPNFRAFARSGNFDYCPWIRDKSGNLLALRLGEPVLQCPLSGAAGVLPGEEDLGPRLQVQAIFKSP